MINLKSPDQIELMRRSSKILVNTLSRLKKYARAGIKTKELNIIGKDLILSSGARPAFLGYRGYPGSICVSVNEEIVHGIPGERILLEGDVLSIDAGVELNGFFSDAALTVIIGRSDERHQKLVAITREALYKSIECVRPGRRISDVSCAVQEYVENNGFSVIREFVGHGIGSDLHEDPQIPNFGQPGMGVMLKEGMVLAIEPMVSAGKWQVEILEDGWTAVTKDRSCAAHFEHTVAVGPESAQILTEGAF